MPGGGLLADAVVMKLLPAGFDLIDTATVSNIVTRNNIEEVEIALPENLAVLHENGIDALFNLGFTTGYDNRPSSAAFRLIETATGFVIAGGSWQNGACTHTCGNCGAEVTVSQEHNGAVGMQGSVCDSAMRVGLDQAAEDIAAGLFQGLGLPGS